MEKPLFQFGLKAVFAAMTGATCFLATIVAMTGTATVFGTFLGAMFLCAVATLGLGFVAWTILYLIGLTAVVVVRPPDRSPTRHHFRVATLMLTASAAVVAGFCVFVVAVTD